MTGKKDSKRFSRKKTNYTETLVEAVSPVNSAMDKMGKEHVDDFLRVLADLLDEYGCEEMIQVEFRDTDSPFFTAPRLRVASEGDCARNMLYRYIRKTENYKEKIRITVQDLKEKKELGGLEVKGKLIDYILFKVILDLVKYTRTLTVLRLVDCSLKAEAISILGNELGRTSVTHLHLDRNPVELQNYYCILEKNEPLRHLSLVQCRINEKGARLLGQQLAFLSDDQPKHRLRSLNLSSNRIDSYGAKFIAQGLKWNRDLVFLSLAGNEIGNIGIEFIAKAMRLSKLEKWEKELKERRLIERTEQVKKVFAEGYAAGEREMMEGNEYVGEGEDQFEEHSFEKLLEEYITNDPNPLSRDVIQINDDFVTSGNRTLRVLDISYNKIEEEGFEHLLNTLRYQMKERILMPQELRDECHLSTINLIGNFFPDRSKVIRKINYYLKEMKLMHEVVKTVCREEEEFNELEVNGEMEEEDRDIIKEQHVEKIPEPQTPKRILRSRGLREPMRIDLDDTITINLDELLILPQGSSTSSLENFDNETNISEKLVEEQAETKEHNIPCESN